MTGLRCWRRQSRKWPIFVENKLCGYDKIKTDKLEDETGRDSLNGRPKVKKLSGKRTGF
jgi:hypothetical protein